MIKKIENNKNIIISHIADIDGAGSIVIANKYFNNNIDYILCDIKDLLEVFSTIDFSNYETVYLCDLMINADTINYLNNHEEITSKLKHFDHHLHTITAPYVNFHVNVNDIPTCGTELFYNYIKDLDNKFENEFYHTFVEATRQQDNFDFSDKEDMAKLLSYTHALIGPEKYISLINSLDDTKEFNLPDIYKDLYQLDLEKQQRYINFVNDNLLITNLDNYQIGVTIAENYRSIVGHAICDMHPEIDFIMIINYARNTVSLRSVKEDINLNDICKLFHHNGGGHKSAAGFAIDEESIPKLLKYHNMYLENLGNKDASKLVRKN